MRLPVAWRLSSPGHCPLPWALVGQPSGLPATAWGQAMDGFRPVPGLTLGTTSFLPSGHSCGVAPCKFSPVTAKPRPFLPAVVK